MHKKSTFILAEEVEFIMKIHNKTDDKIREMQEATGIELQEVTSYESLKKVTDLIMTKLRKSDRNFLFWLHFVGHYIKTICNGRWALIKRREYDSLYYSPLIIADDTAVWLVGDFCYTYYYAKKRMHGISFETFYKLEIEKLIFKPKWSDLNIPEKDLIILEN